MERFETFEHEADVGIRGYGRTMEEAFAHAAVALYSVMVQVDRITPREKRDIEVTAPDRELLLVEWLNALLSLSDIERMVFSKFTVHIKGSILKGAAWGEPLDRMRHEPKVEVKGATYYLLRVGEENGVFLAQCVVDV